MINHIRTLLLNARADCLGSVPGEEYVSPAFREVTPPLPLRRVRSMLFGAKPSRIDLNYRLRQIMSLLHSTELEEYVLQPDSRVTYWPQGASGLQDHRMPPLPAVLAEIEQELSPAEVSELFGDTTQEPYATFYACWKRNDQIAYKLGGLALAIALRTEEAGVN